MTHLAVLTSAKTSQCRRSCPAAAGQCRSSSTRTGVTSSLNISTGSEIRRFDLLDILGAEHSSTVSAECASSTRFYCFYENSFQILSDEATVVGIEYNDLKELIVLEHLDQDDPEYRPTVFRGSKNKINTLLLCEELDVLLAGDDDGTVVQFALSTATVTRDYGYLGVGGVLACARMGSLALFGGFDDLAVLLLDKQRVFDVPMETAMGSIYSLRCCVVDGAEPREGPRVLVTIDGKEPDYSSPKTDVFDATGLVRHFKEEISPRAQPFFAPLLTQTDKRQIEKLAEELRVKDQQKFEISRKLTSQNSELVGKLKQRQKNISDLESKLSQTQNEHRKELKRRNTQYDKLSDQMSLRNKQLEEELRQAQAETGTLREAVAEAQGQIEQMRESHEREMKTRDQELVEFGDKFKKIKQFLQVELEAKDGRIAELESKQGDSSQTIRRLELAVDQLRHKNKQLSQSQTAKNVHCMLRQLVVLAHVSEAGLTRYKAAR